MVDFKLNRAGVKELLFSKKMKSCLDKHASEILGRLPNGYGVSRGETTQRAKVTVGTRTWDAENDNKQNNTLLKAIK